jgi:hypothetical protein
LNGIDVLTLAPALWLAATVVLLAWRGRRLNREMVLLGAALMGTAANLASPGAYAEYATPLLLPLAIAVLLLAEKLSHAWSTSRRLLLVTVLVLAQGAVPPLANLMTSTRRHNLASWWLTPSMRDYDPNLRQRNAIIRDLVARYLPEGAPLFGPNLIPALELGRPVPAHLAMGPFSVTRELPPDQAHRMHLCTDDDLLDYLSDPRVTVISFADRGIMNYGWSMPSFSSLPAGVTPDWSKIITRDFVPAMRARNYVILVRRSSLGTASTGAR